MLVPIQKFFKGLGDFVLKFVLIFTIFLILSIYSIIIFFYGPVPFPDILLHGEQIAFDLSTIPAKYYVMISIIILFLLLLTFWLRHIVKKTLLFILLFFSCAFFVFSFEPVEINTKTSFYEENYKYPLQQNYVASNKKNIIFIHLESIEDTTLNEKLTPILSKLKKENLSFSNYQYVYGTGSTISSLISTYNALPLKSQHLLSQPESFLIKATSFFDILNQQGYTTVFFPTNIYFTHTGQYLENQNCTQILSRPQSFVSSEKNNFFGLDDKDTFNIAKTEILRLSAENKPFFFGFQTINTHIPGGVSSDCPVQFEDMRDAIFCLDKRIGEFISWLQKQSFYENTLVVLMGDHLMPKIEKYVPTAKKLEKSERHILNILIHSNKVPVGQIDKPYTALDMAPTILEAAGIDIQSHQFGLGTSLFSEKTTLVEQIGKEALEKEIKKSSDLYDSFCNQ